MQFLLDNFWSLLITAGFAIGGYLLAQYLLSRFLLGFLRRTRPDWAQRVAHSYLLRLLALLAPLLIIATGAQTLDAEYWLSQIIHLIVNSLIILNLALIANALINIGLTLYEEKDIAKRVPLRGLAQLIKVTLFVLAGLIVLSVLLQIPAAITFTSVAAIAAAAGFIFRDPILGFIAGIQLAGNDMVAIGDWIQMPKYNANGAVCEISLMTVKVRNWDNSITTIPPYAMVSDSFVNWRSMFESGGRRIQRAILLDVHTIAPCSPEQIDQLIAAGLFDPQSASPVREASAVTNLTLLRTYLLQYLQSNPGINQEMIMMVRQLAPTDTGLPLEVYAFSKVTAWVPFEALQNTIFEHIYAILPDFGLRLYQRQRSGNYADAPSSP